MIRPWAVGILISMIAAFPPAAIAVTPFNLSDRASVGEAGVNIAAERIVGAFAALTLTNIGPLVTDAAVQPPKGDFAPVDCSRAAWPNIGAACLSTADGSPARHVRTITIGYQADANTTVLVRIPAAEMAQR